MLLRGIPQAAVGQNRIRLPADSPPTLGPTGSTLPGWSPVPGGVPGGGASLGTQIQPFDPYLQSNPGTGPAMGFPYNSPFTPTPSSAPYSAPAAPWTLPPPSSLPPFPPQGTVPPSASVAPTYPGVPPATLPPTLLPPTGTAPIYGIPPTYNPVIPNYGTPQWGSAYPQPLPPPPVGGVTPVPQPVFPEGWNWGPPQRLFQDTGAVYTYLYGNEGDELQIHEVEIFSSLVLNYFANNTYGFRVTPGFVFDFLDGPQDVAADLPATLYSAYLDAAWKPQFTPQFSGDINVRTGVYSDFNTFTSHSLRITGKGLGVVQLTPTLALKLGVEYLDRARIKLLPAGGFLWEPDAETRWDIYFPRPKFSKYWRTVGNTDVWWHIGAEYGGGSWTIDRLDNPLLGASERIDINDIRVYLGFDWDRLTGFDGLFQVGYVFDREIVFKEVPSETTGLDDTFMVRLGLQF